MKENNFVFNLITKENAGVYMILKQIIQKYLNIKNKYQVKLDKDNLIKIGI